MSGVIIAYLLNLIFLHFQAMRSIVRFGRPGHAAATSQGDPSSLRLSRKVLVVDDNLASLEAMDTFLRVSGYDTLAAASGEEALEAMRVHRPSMILLDIAMPGMDGFEVLGVIRGAIKSRPPFIVAVTAFSSESALRRIEQSGFDAYCPKPVDVIGLLDLVSELEAHVPAC